MKGSYYEKYSGKLILAPMVKIGTLPTRILALRYGCDLVYTEEIIDWKFLRSKRVINQNLGTIDYIDETDESVFFQTCEEEKHKVILQIGTSDPERALKVAQLTEEDVSGIDINMGCPKEFSIKGGMGAALLTNPEKIQSILTLLVKNCKIPITCKIRVLPSLEETLKLCSMIEKTGVAAIAVHGRTKHERPQHPNRNDFLKEIAKHVSIPVIANGVSREIESFRDVCKQLKETGCSSLMLARAAEWNLSIFKNQPNLDSIENVIQDFLNLAVQYNLPFSHGKYTIQRMLKSLQESEYGQRFLATLTMSELCDWGGVIIPSKSISHNYFNPNLKRNNSVESKDEDSLKRSKIETSIFEEDGVIVVPNCAYIRGHYEALVSLPKSRLLSFANKNGYKNPNYSLIINEKRFQGIVEFGGSQFRTNLWERNKKSAEQAAALACLKYLESNSSFLSKF